LFCFHTPTEWQGFKAGASPFFIKIQKILWDACDFDEENCNFFVTMTIKALFVRKHNFLGFPASPEWDEGHKQLWKSVAYLAVLQYFECLPLRCKPTNAACCVCKNGVKVRFSIQFIEDGKADVKAKVSSFTGDRSSAELAGDNANLDWDDPWGANNAATPGGKNTIYQNTLIHEIGHLLGWVHPGQKLPTGQRAKPGSDADYYAKPQSLMGVGMEMTIYEGHEGQQEEIHQFALEDSFAVAMELGEFYLCVKRQLGGRRPSIKVRIVEAE
jgi:hypothetical protein